MYKYFSEKLLHYLYERTKESSTWRGIIIGMTGALGLHISPDLLNATISLGLALSGILGVVLPDKVTRS